MACGGQGPSSRYPRGMAVLPPACSGQGRPGPEAPSRGPTTPRACAAGRRAAIAAALSVALATAAGGEVPDGRFDRRSSEHFVLYQDVGHRHRTGTSGSNRFEREVLDTLEEAHDGLRDLLGVAPRSRITVVVYGSEDFDARFAGVAAFPAAGFYHGVIRVRGALRVSSELERVLRHEYVHAALDAAAPSLVLPALVNEGLAEWFARRSLRLPVLEPWEVGILARNAQQGALPPLSRLLGPSFGRLSPRAAALAYLQSRAFVAHLAHHHGEDRLLDFWRSLVRSGRFDRALERAFGRDLAEIDRRMRADLRG